MYININYIYNLYIFVYYIEYILICICCIYYGNIKIKHKIFKIYNIVGRRRCKTTLLDT